MKIRKIMWYDFTFTGGWVAITAGFAETWRGWAISMGALVILYSILAAIYAALSAD